MQTVLTIAGSDSGGGAGLQADLKTFEAHGVFGATVVTAITAQNTQGVDGVFPVPGTQVKAQLAALTRDLKPAALKLGLMGNAAGIRAIESYLRRYAKHVPIVLDPVMVATSGDELLPETVRPLILERIMPMATLITPNIPEAEALSGLRIRTLSDAKAAAAKLGEQLPDTFILVKGGHGLVASNAAVDADLAEDILYYQGDTHVFSEPFIPAGPLHGTGCTYSSAIAARLALGHPITEAIKLAKAYVTNAILLAPKTIGQGARPLRHNQPMIR